MENNFKNIKNKNLFKVPDNYFENFEEKLFSKLPQNNKKKNYIRSIAASIVLLLGLVIVLKSNNKNQIENNTVLANAEIEEFMVNEEWDEEIYFDLSNNFKNSQSTSISPENTQLEEEILEIIEEEIIETEEIL